MHSVILLSVFHQFETACKLQSTSHTLTGYGGQTLAVEGMWKYKMDCVYKGRSMMLDFYVVNTKAPPVLGLSACLDLDLIKLLLAVNAPGDQKIHRREVF